MIFITILLLIFALTVSSGKNSDAGSQDFAKNFSLFILPLDGAIAGPTATASALAVAGTAFKDPRQMSSEEFQEFSRFASFAIAAYKPDDQLKAWSCDYCVERLTGTTVHHVFSNSASLRGYIARNDGMKAIIIAFMGTKTTFNMLTDANFFKRPLFDIYGKVGLPIDTFAEKKEQANVHSGFLNLYMTERAIIIQQIKEMRMSYPDYAIYLTGHSLGGALATICGLDLARELKQTKIRVVSFSAPRVGGKHFAQLVNKTPNLTVSRIVHSRDPVPHLPPTMLKFRHAGREYWIPKKKGFFVYKCNYSPEDAKEDPTCSAGKFASLDVSLHSTVRGHHYN